MSAVSNACMDSPEHWRGVSVAHGTWEINSCFEFQVIHAYGDIRWEKLQGLSVLRGGAEVCIIFMQVILCSLPGCRVQVGPVSHFRTSR